jgi:hypothetical protein
MLENPTYRARWERKLDEYRRSGILRYEDHGGPHGTLIVTHDEPNGGIDSAKIAKIIDEVILRGCGPGASGAASDRAALRELIQTVMRSDPDLDAFCLDYFKKEVYDAFTGGMERSQKITILLRNADHTQIRMRLRERWPEARP